MINSALIEKHFQQIHSMMRQLSATEKEILSDKLLAWLLFKTEAEPVLPKQKTARKTPRKRTTPVSKKDQELLKKIADKTDELYKRLGGDTI